MDSQRLFSRREEMEHEDSQEGEHRGGQNVNSKAAEFI